jgi:hypothetical protein
VLLFIVIFSTVVFLTAGFIYAKRRRIPPNVGGPMFPSDVMAPRPSWPRRDTLSDRQRRRRGMREANETCPGQQHGSQFWGIVNHPDSNLADLKNRGRGV